MLYSFVLKTNIDIFCIFFICIDTRITILFSFFFNSSSSSLQTSTSDLANDKNVLYNFERYFKIVIIMEALIFIIIKHVHINLSIYLFILFVFFYILFYFFYSKLDMRALLEALDDAFNRSNKFCTR